VVGLAVTASGQGVWLAASDGTVSAQGDATGYPPPAGTGTHTIVGIAGL